MEERQCTICLKNIKTQTSKTLLNEIYTTKCKCKYYYHNRCIKTWINQKKNCPICRYNVFNNNFEKCQNSMKNYFIQIILYYINFILCIKMPFIYFICILSIICIPLIIYLKLNEFFFLQILIHEILIQESFFYFFFILVSFALIYMFSKLYYLYNA